MSTLDLKNIQGDILLDGLPKRVESFFFFQITDGHIKDFCRSLKTLANDISHVDNTAQMRQDIGAGRRDEDKLRPTRQLDMSHGGFGLGIP